MREFLKLIKKAGGFSLLKQYMTGHILLYALFLTLFNGFSQKSLEIVRLSVSNKLLGKLRKKYKRFVLEYVRGNRREEKACAKDQKRKVWVCWFQGLDNAPDIVRKCHKFMVRNIRDREIVLITDHNYRDFVRLPDYIQKKIEAGIISRTHMSDLLRLELLKRYGGTWIDATVLLTGSVPDYMLDTELFLFQNLKPGLDGHCTSISNWFITAKPGNRIIELTLALLYEYWRKNDNLVDYYIFHDFFQIAAEAYPEDWKKVVPVSNAVPHILLLRLFEQYDERVWEAVKEQSSVHKLSYKNSAEDREKKGTYYRKIMLGEERQAAQ